MALTMPTRGLGQVLGKTINRGDHPRDLEHRVAHLEGYLATQHAITQIIARSSELETALPRILEAICTTTDWDFGEVWHIDRRDDSLCCAATWCSPSSRFPTFETSGWEIKFASGKGLPGRVWASRTPLWMTNVSDDANFVRAKIAQKDGVCAGLGIPIRTDGEVIGVLTFFSRQARRPDRDLLRMLDTVGSQIGLFIERKRIEQSEREQAHLLAVLSERQRLARDLHDSVTQTLFSASVIAEMLPLLYSRDPEQVKSNLDELHQLTRGALTEMRSLLVELRPSPTIKGEIGDLLKNLVQTFQNRTPAQVMLEVRTDDTLTAVEQTVIYRITQEALNNITKHAAATCVSIRLNADKARIELMIEDNGRGFDPSCLPVGHFGVEGMRERAKEIGAALRIDSAPGAGARLCLTHPGSTPV